MNRKKILLVFVFILFLANIVTFSPKINASQGTKPVKDNTKIPHNIVLIVIDDLGYGDLGIYGNKIHQTPNLDRLAKGGILFTDFHSNGPVCSPTRAALMTGQYQQRTGIEHAIGFTREEGMPLEKITIAEILNERGYISGVFGKWHLGCKILPKTDTCSC
jgi:arylsulfatase A